MKNLLFIVPTILFISFTTIDTQTYFEDTNSIELKAEFVGKSKKSLYFKKVEDSKMMEFTILSMAILSKYDFDNKDTIGKIFMITYEVQKVETGKKDIKDGGDVEVSQFVERKTLMDVEEVK